MIRTRLIKIKLAIGSLSKPQFLSERDLYYTCYPEPLSLPVRCVCILTRNLTFQNRNGGRNTSQYFPLTKSYTRSVLNLKVVNFLLHKHSTKESKLCRFACSNAQQSKGKYIIDLHRKRIYAMKTQIYDFGGSDTKPL